MQQRGVTRWTRPMQGCASIFGLSVEQTGVRALIQYARVLLMSTTALCGPTMCPGSERVGCPSGVITDRPRCTTWCESSWCKAACCMIARPMSQQRPHRPTAAFRNPA